MKERPFREYHILNILTAYEQQSLPLDLFISHYFRVHKALGPKDRGVIADAIYAMVRWQGLLDYLCENPPSWEKRYHLYSTTHLRDYESHEEIPLHVRLSFPKVLFDLICKSHGAQKAVDLCRISNQTAPTTLRINPLKTTREAMLERWKKDHDVSACPYAEYGVIFHKKINFFGTEEFKQGLFEVQDEGSQLLADLVKAEPGQLVLDYCAGSGGKTLAFAHRMQNKGQIYLHDVRSYILQQAKKRLRRAGIQNAQIVEAEDPKLKKLKKKMDWVLVDAPCSGTGTMRRNPDMKWSFTEETLNRLLGQQRTIFEKALSFMHPEGRIVYATCSLLNEENQFQLEHFRKTYQLVVEGEPFQSLPKAGGMDGFFGVVLRKDF